MTGTSTGTRAASTDLTNDPREVLTMAIQMLFYQIGHDRDYLIAMMARRDPEMLDLILGVLFRYDP